MSFGRWSVPEGSLDAHLSRDTPPPKSASSCTISYAAAMRLVIASTNPHKAVEMEQVLTEVLAARGATAGAISVLHPPSDYIGAIEDGDTLEDNARIKAQACFAATGEASVADDTGLEVDALGGAPGVRTARYASETATDAQNRQKLLAELKDISPEQRSARFRTVVVVRLPEDPDKNNAVESAARGIELVAQGHVEGTITTSERGTGGFGYDSLFVPTESNGRTFAEMTSVDKHTISHRGRALRAMAVQLAEHRW